MATKRLIPIYYSSDLYRVTVLGETILSIERIGEDARVETDVDFNYLPEQVKHEILFALSHDNL